VLRCVVSTEQQLAGSKSDPNIRLGATRIAHVESADSVDLVE